jgi:hypothetical protein
MGSIPVSTWRGRSGWKKGEKKKGKEECKEKNEEIEFKERTEIKYVESIMEKSM